MLIWLAQRTDKNIGYDQYRAFVAVAPDFKTVSVDLPKTMLESGPDRIDHGLPVSDEEWVANMARWNHAEDSDRPLWEFQVIGEAIGDSSTRIICKDFLHV